MSKSMVITSYLMTRVTCYQVSRGNRAGLQNDTCAGKVIAKNPVGTIQVIIYRAYRLIFVKIEIKGKIIILINSHLCV